MNTYRVEVVMSYWDTIHVDANSEAEAKATALDLFSESRMRQGEGEVTDVQLIKTLEQLEQENPEGFRNPDDTPVLRLSGTLKTLEQLEAESTDGFRNPERD